MSSAVTGATPIYLRSMNTWAPGTSLVMCSLAVVGAAATDSGVGEAAGRGIRGVDARGAGAGVAGTSRAATAGADVSRTGSGRGFVVTGSRAGEGLARSKFHTAIAATPITATIPSITPA